MTPASIDGLGASEAPPCHAALLDPQKPHEDVRALAGLDARSAGVLRTLVEADSIRSAAAALGMHHSTVQARHEALTQTLGYDPRTNVAQMRYIAAAPTRSPRRTSSCVAGPATETPAERAPDYNGRRPDRVSELVVQVLVDGVRCRLQRGDQRLQALRVVAHAGHRHGQAGQHGAVPVAHRDADGDQTPL